MHNHSQASLEDVTTVVDGRLESSCNLYSRRTDRHQHLHLVTSFDHVATILPCWNSLTKMIISVRTIVRIKEPFPRIARLTSDKAVARREDSKGPLLIGHCFDHLS